MDLLIKHAQKLISYEFSSGLVFVTLIDKLRTACPQVSFAETDLLSALISNLDSYNLTMDPASSPKNPRFLAKRPLIDKATKQDILGLFLTEDEDKKEVITNIYEIIVRAREGGINYSEINQKLKKRMKLDLEINMISHYCRKLASCNLVEITATKTCKNVVSKIFTPSVLRKSGQRKSEVLEEDKREGSTGGFNFRELTFKQNVLVNLMSAEANLKNGLTLIELGEKIGKPKETKMLNRYLSGIQKDYGILIKADRQGRLFSHRYLIKNEEMLEKLRSLQEEGQRKEEVNSLLAISEPAQRQKVESVPRIHEIMKNELKKQESLVLCAGCFIDLAEIFNRNREYNEILRKFIEDSALFHDFLSLQYLSVKEREELIAKRFAIPSARGGKNKYEILTENMIKILIEKVEFDMIKRTGSAPEGVNNRSKKQVSALKINRYIFALNEIYEAKILAIQTLKQRIIELEFEAGIGKIDRKTILFMLESLEAVGLIRLIYKDLGTFIKSSQGENARTAFKPNKNMVILHGYSENDSKVEEIVAEFHLKREADAKGSFAKRERVNERSKKIGKSKRSNGKIATKQEFNVKFENLLENRNNREERDLKEKEAYSFAKVDDEEMRLGLLSRSVMRTLERVRRKNLRFSWRKMTTNMEMLGLMEALSKVGAKEPRRNNFLSFSRKFDDLNEGLDPRDRPFFPVSSYDGKAQNLSSIVAEIDRNIERFEGAMEIEGESETSVSMGSVSENRGKHERIIEKIKHLLVKYPVRRMKEIETQLNNINYVDMIWRELYRNGMIEVVRLDENGAFSVVDEVNFNSREEYYYKVTQRLYDFV